MIQNLNPGNLGKPSGTLLILLLVCLAAAPGCSRKQIVSGRHPGPVVNVLELGASPDGVTDATSFFQKAIDSLALMGGGTVVVPPGSYLIDADVSVKLKSHITLEMTDTLSQLIAKPTKSERFNMLFLLNVTDVTIKGGKLVGDRDRHLGTTGEWGMGIAVYASSRIHIEGTTIVNCWGDGIVVGAQSRVYNAPTASRDVTIKKVTADNNRRQGLTIGKADGVLVDSCTFTNTNGTKPMCGIDIEPDRDTAQNITIQNSHFAYNKGNGIEMYAHAPGAAVPSTIRNVTVKNNWIHHNTYGGYVIRAQNVTFSHNRIIDNKYAPPVKTVDAVNSVFEPNIYQ